jgi:hypothetical protein
MKRRVLLLLAIFVFIAAAVFLIIADWKKNDAARMIGLILVAICALINILRGFIRMSEDK